MTMFSTLVRPRALCGPVMGARTLSLDLRQQLFAQEASEFLILLLTITHPSLADPIRLSTDNTQRLTTDPLVYCTMSRGNTFLYVGLHATLPDEADDSPPAAKLIISNVDRSIIPLARSVSYPPPAVLMEAVLASDPDTVEFTVPKMDMVNLTYDVNSLTFDLAIDALALEPFPAGSMDPSVMPGLFS